MSMSWLRTCVTGCRLPFSCFTAGIVTSIFSASYLFRSASASSFFIFSSMIVSMAVRVSLTHCPTFGRSSGATSFIPFNTAVSSPFFPSTAWRTSFRRSNPSDPSISAIAFSLICCNFSFISNSPLNYFRHQKRNHPSLL